jgi:DNA ligase 1
MYKFIINPQTNRRVKITSKLGRNIFNEYINQCGAGICKLCGSDGTNARTCPLNPKSKKTAANARKHPLAKVAPAPGPASRPVPRPAPRPVRPASRPVPRPAPRPVRPASRPVAGTGARSGRVFDVSGGVLLAKEFTKKDGSDAVNPVGWWASEKYDGYRAIWDGEKFLSRNNKPLVVPTFISDLMPRGIALDGELWMGRGCFEQCGVFRRKRIVEKDWRQARYAVFDIPSMDAPFEERMATLQELVDTECAITPHCPLVMTEQTRIESREHLQEMFAHVTREKGEGIMIRKPGSRYEQRRSNILLKMKVVFDNECRIVGYKAGAGKYTGKLGSFECILLDEEDERKTFYVSGMNDVIRDSYRRTHPIGTILTVQYNDVSKRGIPRHPRYMRIRSDAGL